ncbi:hypothetical protein [Bifidobacterium apri]|uniref:Transposase n=1 Tax=Bifidobacterium apri TaxID=1769423 RepID=A0A6A2WBV2_9BIFI|nr:hypothetical protein [Bifidobacterium apri]KAB8291519.1 transposase [Bifidobacterium apri]
MPTNVTQKDQTLQAVIEWAKTERALAWSHGERAENGFALKWEQGRLSAFDQMIAHCSRMMGYTGSMPLEVENQSEDAK